MASWKKILTDGDNTNLGSTNLTQADSSRTYTITGSGSSLKFISENSTEILRLSSGPSNAQQDGVLFQAKDIEVKGAVASQPGKLTLFEASNDGSDTVSIAAPNLTEAYTLTLPTADGTNGQALTTNGSGALSFSTISGGGGTIDGSGGTDRIAIWSDSDTLTSDSEITYAAAQHRILAGSFTANVVSGVAATGVVTSQTLQSAEINVGVVSVNTVGAFGTGSRLLVKAGSFQGTLSAGRVMRYSQGQGTNPITTADHTSAAAGTTMLFCTTDAVTPQELLLEGSIKMATNQGWSTAAQGTPLYLGSSGGVVQSSPPTVQGYYSRIIGYVLDASNSIIYFCPDRSWVKIS